MSGYAVVSSVRFRLLTRYRPTPRLTESPLPTPGPIHGPARFVTKHTTIVYLGGCQLSFGREQLGSRGIIFQGE